MNFLLMLIPLLQLLLHIFSILLSVAFFTLVERKVLGYIHFRKGPNKVGPLGVFQPFADAIKLLTKDDMPVYWSNKLIFYLAPMFLLFLSISIWIITPSVYSIISFDFSLLIIMLMLGLNVYGVIFSGWASNSKYALLGSMRAITQGLSYEVILGFIFLSFMMLVNSFSLITFFNYKMINVSMMAPFLLIIFITSLLVEGQRVPFDLSEGESELVAGYTVEYGGVMYLIAFLTENVMVFFSAFLINFFFIYSSTLFINMMIYTMIITFLCIIRGALPRIRYDKLMNLCWKYLLPLTLVVFNLLIFLSKVL